MADADATNSMIAQLVGYIPAASGAQRSGSNGDLGPLLSPTTQFGGAGVPQTTGRQTAPDTAVAAKNTTQLLLNQITSAQKPNGVAPQPSGVTPAGPVAAAPATSAIDILNGANTFQQVVTAQAQTIGNLANITAFSYKNKVNIPVNVASGLSVSTLKALQTGDKLSQNQKREVQNVGGKSLREQITNAQ